MLTVNHSAVRKKDSSASSECGILIPCFEYDVVRILRVKESLEIRERDNMGWA